MFRLTDLKQDAVLAHIAEVGPLAVNVDASQWHSYTGLHRKLFWDTFFGHLSSHRSRPCILVFYKTPEKVLLLTDWSFSPGGIFDGCDYAQNMDLNHVVQMVGDSLF